MVAMRGKLPSTSSEEIPNPWKDVAEDALSKYRAPLADMMNQLSGNRFRAANNPKFSAVERQQMYRFCEEHVQKAYTSRRDGIKAKIKNRTADEANANGPARGTGAKKVYPASPRMGSESKS